MQPTSSAPPAVRVVRVPSTGDVDGIAALADPVVRNLRITHTYHLLAVRLAASTGAGANWCAFAVWASRQAGCTIRGEDVLDLVERRLRADPRLVERIGRVWRGIVLHALAHRDSKRSLLLRIVAGRALAQASDAVARGNLRVFEEIAREFARFLPLCDGGPIGQEALDAFLAGLRPGAPPGGQDHLRSAFTHYARALQATDRDTRAELLLLANLEIGLHEQTRLQPEILAALEVPFESVVELGRRMLRVLAPGSSRWSGLLRTPLSAFVGAAARTAATALRGLLRHLVTERMMTLAFPDGVIHLGRDLGGEYPACLRQPRTPELVELLGRFVPATGDRDGAGADDWAVLEERMQLIARLFRLRHEDPALLTDPYTPDQVAALEAGRVPEGDL